MLWQKRASSKTNKLAKEISFGMHAGGVPLNNKFMGVDFSYRVSVVTCKTKSASVINCMSCPT